MTDLLPCPFCGEPPVITKHHREEMWGFLHRCPILGAISWGFTEDRQSHVYKWNRRAPVASPAGTAKASTCCLGEQLIPMRGSDTKLCTGCKTEKHWPLEPGQKRTL